MATKLREPFGKRRITERLLCFIGAFAVASIVQPLVSLASSSMKARTDSAGESRYASLDGARIHYVNYGKGSEPLTFIECGNWRDQIADFTRRNRMRK